LLAEVAAAEPGLRRFMGRCLAYLFIWTVLVLAFAAVTGRKALDYYRLKNSGVSTQGIAMTRKPHNQIEYSFRAGEVAHTDVGVPGMGSPPVDKIALGQTVPVYFLPQNPDISCLGSPEELLRNELPPVLAVTLLFPSAIVGVIAFRRARARRKSR